MVSGCATCVWITLYLFSGVESTPSGVSSSRKTLFCLNPAWSTKISDLAVFHIHNWKSSSWCTPCQYQWNAWHSRVPMPTIEADENSHTGVGGRAAHGFWYSSESNIWFVPFPLSFISIFGGTVEGKGCHLVYLNNMIGTISPLSFISIFGSTVEGERVPSSLP